MHPYTGDYTEQRKNGKLNFIYYTFTPRPLKGNTFFKIDDELMALLIETYHTLGLLEGVLQYAPNKNSFCELMLLKECTYSRMIDYYGALDFRNILVKREAGKGNIESIKNLMSAYKSAVDMQFAAQEYSKICSIALYGDKAEQQISIRNTQTFLQRAISNLKTYNPTALEDVLPSLADISAYLYDSEDDPLIQAALVHYQFEMIHPFEKYNGIVGRILIFMVLKKIAGKALSGLCLSEHLFFNKNEYFDILSSTQYSGGYVRWIKYFIRIINEATQTSVDLLKKYEETIKLDEEKLRAKVPKTKSVWSVYEYLKVSPVTSIPITAEHLKLSYNSVSKAFATLKKYNIIMQRNNSTRNRIWEYTCLDFIFTLPSINQVTCN